MNSKSVKVANYVGWHRENDGRLSTCRYCRETIYFKVDYDGRWRPYESWTAGNCDEGEWILHRCSTPA